MQQDFENSKTQEKSISNGHNLETNEATAQLQPPPFQLKSSQSLDEETETTNSKISSPELTFSDDPTDDQNNNGSRSIQFKKKDNISANDNGQVKEIIQRKISFYDETGTQIVYNSFDDVLAQFGSNEQHAIEQINQQLERGLKFNKLLFNRYIHEIDEYAYGDTEDDFLESIASAYKAMYDQVMREKQTVEESSDYGELRDVYQETEGDDGLEVTDEYDRTLACTLFTVLAIKGSFLGASTPPQLHAVLRSIPEFQLYDEDDLIGALRMMAGLKHNASHKGKTVATFVAGLKKSDEHRKFAIDMIGEAHTFALIHENGAWKRFDNGAENGYQNGAEIGKYNAKKISVVWE